MSEVKLSKLRKTAKSAQATFDAALQSALDPTLNDNPVGFANGRTNLANAKKSLTRATDDLDAYKPRTKAKRKR